MALHKLVWSKKKRAGNEVWFGDDPEKLQHHCKILPLVPDIFTSYSGPDQGLAIIHQLDNESNANNNTTEANPSNQSNRKTSVAGARTWNLKSRKAYGISMSLYDQHPINGRMSGDPIADSFGICGRKNNAIMAVADGVNWGEKSKMAARCAIYGAMNFLHEMLFASSKNIKTTNEVFTLLLRSIDAAHDCIMKHKAGLTTLCVAIIAPIKDSKQFVVCIVNVGDSLAYVFSRRHGVREITTGSHDILAERDMRDAGGALGPVNGEDPELNNLTCSMTYVDQGDIVYLTTDGISDNFDPVVTKLAVPSRQECKKDLKDEEQSQKDDNATAIDGRPEMLPHERHLYASKEMERIIHEFELFTETAISAQELCGALLQHVLKLTDPKRKVLENPTLYGRKACSKKDRARRDSEIVSKMSEAPGKLDHATIIGYEVGHYHGNEDENYEAESDEELVVENANNSGNSVDTVRQVSFESNV